MKLASAVVSAAVLACTLPTLAQEARTGVSAPPVSAETTGAPADATGTDGYRPTPMGTPAAVSSTHHETPVAARTFEPVGPYTASTEVADSGKMLPLTPKNDVDAGIVTSVPHAKNECPAGTIFKVRMKETLSTRTTARGTPFTAELIEPVQENGQVLIPTGTRLDGRVTLVRGGKRIRGAAALHLEPRSLTLPDGTRYDIRAQVIDTDQSFATRIDSEGTIVRRDHIKGTLAAMGLATGGAAAAGGVIGGAPGALIGAGVGAAVSTAWWLKQDRQTVLPEDTAVVFSLNEPVALGSVAN